MLLHHQRAAVFGPGEKVLAGQQEVRGGVGVDRHTQAFGQSGQGGLGVEVVGLQQVDGAHLMAMDPGGEHVGAVGEVGGWDFGGLGFGGGEGVFQAVVEHPMAGLFERHGVVAHGGVEEGELLLVVAQAAGPGGRFDHGHPAVGLRPPQQRVLREQLVSQDPHQLHGPEFGRSGGNPRRWMGSMRGQGGRGS